MNTAARVLRAVQAVVPQVTDVSIGVDTDRSTWIVVPANLQGAAQPTIDAFDPNAQAAIDADTVAQAAASAGQKDLLATLALIAAQTDVNWSTKTLAQKKAAVQALATSWQNLRAFVEKNL